MNHQSYSENIPELTVEELCEALQEFQDNAFHESLKPEISIKAKAIAMRVMKERLERYE